jgi:hypothetical protein
MIDGFVRRVRDAHPPGIDPKNPIMIGGTPDEAGFLRNPTYWRWFVWKRNKFINCYLHNFRRDDEEDLHDHRMINISIVLSRIGYEEDLYCIKPVEGRQLPRIYRHKVKFLRPRIRLPSTPHRVVLYKDAEGRPIPIWSLFIGFPHWRNWGFWCPGNGSARWVGYETYTLGDDPTVSSYGTPGRGCGE